MLRLKPLIFNVKFVCKMTNKKMTFSSRLSKGNKRIVYTIEEYSPLLDSSNMTTEDWGRIGKDIEVLRPYTTKSVCLLKLDIKYSFNTPVAHQLHHLIHVWMLKNVFLPLEKL